MLQITAHEIHEAGGVMAAVSLKSREYARSLIRLQDVQLAEKIKRLNKMQRIVVHASPHLDEYFGVYLLRACLPDELAKLPVQEEVLYSHDNDFRAKQIWTTSILVGIGGPHDGGVKKRPVWIFDEHVNAGKRRKSSSCARMVMEHALRNKLDSLQRPLQFLFGEVDHIDSAAQAHDLHIGNAIKVLHEIRFLFAQDGQSAQPKTGFLDDDWKRIVIEAAFTAVAYAVDQGVKLSDANELYNATKKSLDSYEEHCLWKDDPFFSGAMKHLRQNVLNVKVILNEAVLKYLTDSGAQEPRLDKQGHTIPQRMVMPRIALACNACWGPVLGQIIMAHLWETVLIGQLWFRRVSAGLDPIDSAPGATKALAGAFAMKQLDECVETVTIQKWGKPDIQEKKPVWVLSLVSGADVVAPNKAMTSHVNKQNGGLGLCLVENGRYGTRAIFKCKSFPYSRWARLIDRLFELEGDADDEENPGAWHRTPSAQGLAAPFLVNGNRAHQYVPPSSLDLEALAGLVAQDYRDHPND